MAVLSRHRASGVGGVWYSQLANATGALQIWPEHRYYAAEAPYLPEDDFAHFTIEQSLVDHIELVLYVQALTNLTRNPVIAIGSSYSKRLSCLTFLPCADLSTVHTQDLLIGSCSILSALYLYVCWFFDSEQSLKYRA